MPRSLKKLADQVIVITGASSGIGLATAYQAAKAGAKVVLTARNEAALQEAVQRIRSEGGQASFVVADVTKTDELKKVAEAAIEQFGGFDTWVNNAGVGIFGRLDEVSDEDHRRLFEVNFWGVVHGTKIAEEHLKSKGGAIINLGSIASDIGFAIQGMYCASKHAIKGFTDAFRMEVEEAGFPISVTLIKPASINTPFPAHAKNYLSQEPKLPPPVYTPDSVAEAILYAAEHGGRDYYIGGGGKLMTSLNAYMPSLVDWAGARTARKANTYNNPPTRDTAGSLHQPGQDGAVHGQSPHFVMPSFYTKAMLNPTISGAILTVVGLAGAAAVLGRRPKT